MAEPRFKVKSNVGRGWRVDGAPECPRWDYRADAQRYCDQRNAGADHPQAWCETERDRVNPPAVRPTLYLVEYYTRNPATGESGWDIRFVWVRATDRAAVRARVALVPDFGEIILIGDQAEVFPLAGCEPSPAGVLSA